VRAAAFPLRTAFVAQELQQDIKEFLFAILSAPLHNWESTINRENTRVGCSADLSASSAHLKLCTFSKKWNQ
jgi:hypothetical protein